MHICGIATDRRTSVRTHVTEFGGVIEVVGGVVFSLTQLDSVELVISSLSD